MEIYYRYVHHYSLKTYPVGQMPPNPWGLYNMYDNVGEWVQDWYHYGEYENATRSVTDPRGPSSGSGRVYRGNPNLTIGSGSAGRDSYGWPRGGDAGVGFRLALSLE
jgi:formylglycine-generating enzyme required for sulfatase activity